VSGRFERWNLVASSRDLGRSSFQVEQLSNRMIATRSGAALVAIKFCKFRQSAL
jgi:hypothetical protein